MSTQMYNIEVEFNEKGTHTGTHTFGIEGSDEDDARQAVQGVLCHLSLEDYNILSIGVDENFNIEEEREKIRLKKEFETKFQEAADRFHEFVTGKTEKHYLVLEDREFVIKSDTEQLNGKIAAVYDPAEA